MKIEFIRKADYNYLQKKYIIEFNTNLILIHYLEEVIYFIDEFVQFDIKKKIKIIKQQF